MNALEWLLCGIISSLLVLLVVVPVLTFVGKFLDRRKHDR